MNLQHLQAFRAVAKNNLNMSHAAKALGISQANISRQIKALEQGLGCTLFVRHGRRLSALTSAGEQVLSLSGDILDRLHNICQLGQQQSNPHQGRLHLAAGYNQARYVLPALLGDFVKNYPHVQLRLHRGTRQELADLAQSMDIDMVVGDADGLGRDMVAVPCWSWHPHLLVPVGHPLERTTILRSQDLGRYPIIVGDPDCGPGSRIARVLEQSGAHILACTDDSDSARAYVRANMGVALLSSLACKDAGAGLKALAVRHLLGSGTSYLCWRRQCFVTAPMRTFAKLYAPHRADILDRAQGCRNASASAELFRNLKTPLQSAPA